MKMEKFDQRDVYANHVWIYCQIVSIFEVSSDILRGKIQIYFKGDITYNDIQK